MKHRRVILLSPIPGAFLLPSLLEEVEDLQ